MFEQTRGLDIETGVRREERERERFVIVRWVRKIKTLFPLRW